MTKGERIKALRKKKGISQIELAKYLHTTKQTISKYENGIVTNIPSDKIEAMATLFGTTPQYLLCWEQEQKKNDIAVDIAVRLRKDDEFLSVVSLLNEFDEEKLQKAKQILQLL